MEITLDRKAVRNIAVVSVLSTIALLGIISTGAKIATAAATGNLHITEVVSGGSADPSDFKVHIKMSGQPDTGSPSAQGSDITFTSLIPGSYTIVQSSISGYTTTFSGDCDSHGNVTVAANATPSCTITNTFATVRGGGGTGGTGGGGGSGGGSGNSGRPPAPPRPTR